MPVRVRYSVTVAVSSTPAEERDLGNVSWSIVTDIEAKGGTWKTTLSAGASNVQLQIDNISTIQFLALRTTTVNPNDTLTLVNIRKNSTSGEVTEILPLGDALEGHMLISTDGITAIYASNPGSVDINLTVVAAGI
jgi:hypothetical protein